MAVSGNSRAVFLDKDGTVVDNVAYNVDPTRMTLAPGASDGLRVLQSAGYKLIVISNQSGVARGHFAEDALTTVHRRLRELLSTDGVTLDGFYYCPHHPDGEVDDYATACSCRKPEPGLVLRAAKDHGVDRSRSWLVGDILDDVEAGRRSGCRTVLVDNGSETEWVLSRDRRPHYIVRDLAEAARVIVAADDATARREDQRAGGAS